MVRRITSASVRSTNSSVQIARPTPLSKVSKDHASRHSVLGPVDKSDPEPNASEHDEAEEAGCGLVMAGGNPALFLEMTNEALDA